MYRDYPPFRRNLADAPSGAGWPSSASGRLPVPSLLHINATFQTVPHFTLCDGNDRRSAAPIRYEPRAHPRSPAVAFFTMLRAVHRSGAARTLRDKLPAAVVAGPQLVTFVNVAPTPRSLGPWGSSFARCTSSAGSPLQRTLPHGTLRGRRRLPSRPRFTQTSSRHSLDPRAAAAP